MAIMLRIFACAMMATAVVSTATPPDVPDPVLRTVEGTIVIGVAEGSKVKIAPLNSDGSLDMTKSSDIATLADLEALRQEMNNALAKKLDGSDLVTDVTAVVDDLLLANTSELFVAMKQQSDDISTVNSDLATYQLQVTGLLNGKLDSSKEYTDAKVRTVVEEMVANTGPAIGNTLNAELGRKANKDDAVKSNEIITIVEGMVAENEVNDLNTKLEDLAARTQALEDEGDHPCGQHCAAGDFVDKFCTSTTPTSCKSCDAESYSFGGLQQSCITCKRCEDEQFISKDCTTSSNRVCGTCDVCDGSSEYETTACTLQSNRVCAACRECNANEYITSPCDGKNNAQCKSCSTCETNEIMVSACTTTADTVCISKNIGFRAVFIGEGQSVTSIGWTTITRWTTTRSGFDTLYTSGHFDGTKFTAPVNGYYWATSHVRLDGMDTSGFKYARLIISVNDVSDQNSAFHHIQNQMASNYQTLVANGVVYLKAGETLQVKVFSSGDASYNIQRESGFTVMYIEPEEGVAAEKSGSTLISGNQWTGAVPGWRTSGPVGLFKLGNGFDASTGVYTAQEGGVFLVSANIRLDGCSNTYTRLNGIINGNNDVNNGLHSIYGNSPNNYFSMNFVGAIQLSKGDKFTVAVFSSGDTSYYVHDESDLSIVRIPVSVGFMAEASQSYAANLNDWINLKSFTTSLPHAFNIGGGDFDGSVYKVPQNGHYLCGANQRYDGVADNYIRLAITGKHDATDTFNGGIHSIRGQTPTNYYSLNVAGGLQLSKDEVVEFLAFRKGNDPVTLQSESGMFCVLIGGF